MKVEMKYQQLTTRKIEANLKNDYGIALKNPDFKKLVTNLKIEDKIGYHYTSKLEQTVCDLNNCQKCKGLAGCKNKLVGHVFYPEKRDLKLDFSLIPCKYQKDHLKSVSENNKKIYEIPSDIQNALMKDIDITDKKRTKVIKWLKNYYDKYEKEQLKGLYLHGSFGSGKTYLISALFNEINKKRYDTLVIYYATLVRNLKEAMETNSFHRVMNEVLNVDFLLIDDLGAESITYWSRDEILGSILQHRMDNHLPTFITSNLNLEELESHLKIGNGSDEKIKARRIIERIKQLCEEMELISVNRRN